MKQLRSLVTSDGTLRVSVEEVQRPALGDNDILVQVMATPINPSDLGLLLAGADLSTFRSVGTPDRPAVEAQISPGSLAGLQARFGDSLPVGNESAGVVVDAGSSPEAQSLMGKTVAVLGGAMYAEYRAVDMEGALVLPDGTDPRAGASMFVNPLTALGMTETMRLEGHTALVHTAAASNLGQMLNKICISDGIDLVNIVRKDSQEALLRSIGAVHVVNSSKDSFEDDLTAALTATKATIAFDATGGGQLAGQILAAMERAASSYEAGAYSRYGSTTHKQVYIYGGLDRRPTEFQRNFGMAWSIGGWLLPYFLAAVGAEVGERLRKRVVDEMHTTFASSYTREISLAEVVDPAIINVYAQQATGEKVLVTPQA
jgi:NADPH:quinone reductase-like Zn-dependent oxidoreductase